MTKFLNKTFSVGPTPGSKITDEQWDIAVGNKTMDSAGMAQGMFDGGSSSNPGLGAWAFALQYPDKTSIALLGPLGETTNNRAEYAGLIQLLEYALSHNIRRITVRGDSRLVIEQMKGTWRVKNADLKPLNGQARELAKQFQEIHFEWMPREDNEECDALVKKAIKAQK